MRSVTDQFQVMDADDKGGSLRHILHSRYVSAVLCFAAAFACLWTVGAFPQSSFFWTVLDTRFAADERYQLQRLFLPVRKRQIPAVIVGDAMFHASLNSADNTGSIVINGYDADDLDIVFEGLRLGKRYTKTSVCSLVVQISPLFMVRSKALHESQAIDLIKEVKVPKSLQKRFRDLFRVLHAWAETENTMPAKAADAHRPEALVGQARFADETRENWRLAFEKADKFDGRIIAVLDTRGTRWPDVSDLVKDTRRGLKDLSGRHENLSWTTRKKFEAEHLPGCPS